MDILIALLVLLMVTLTPIPLASMEIGCNNKTFLCYDKVQFYSCIRVGENKTVIGKQRQYCPDGFECDDSADSECQGYEFLELDHTNSKSPATISDSGGKSNLDSITEILNVERNMTSVDNNQNDFNEGIGKFSSETEARIQGFDISDVFTHDTTVTAIVTSLSVKDTKVTDTFNNFVNTTAPTMEQYETTTHALFGNNSSKHETSTVTKSFPTKYFAEHNVTNTTEYFLDTTNEYATATQEIGENNTNGYEQDTTTTSYSVTEYFIESNFTGAVGYSAIAKQNFIDLLSENKGTTQSDLTDNTNEQHNTLDYTTLDQNVVVVATTSNALNYDIQRNSDSIPLEIHKIPSNDEKPSGSSGLQDRNFDVEEASSRNGIDTHTYIHSTLSLSLGTASVISSSSSNNFFVINEKVSSSMTNEITTKNLKQEITTPPGTEPITGTVSYVFSSNKYVSNEWQNKYRFGQRIDDSAITERDGPSHIGSRNNTLLRELDTNSNDKKDVRASTSMDVLNVIANDTLNATSLYKNTISLSSGPIAHSLGTNDEDFITTSMKFNTDGSINQVSEDSNILQSMELETKFDNRDIVVVIGEVKIPTISSLYDEVDEKTGNASKEGAEPITAITFNNNKHSLQNTNVSPVLHEDSTVKVNMVTESQGNLFNNEKNPTYLKAVTETIKDSTVEVIFNETNDNLTNTPFTTITLNEANTNNVTNSGYGDLDTTSNELNRSVKVAAEETPISNKFSIKSINQDQTISNSHEASKVVEATEHSYKHSTPPDVAINSLDLFTTIYRDFTEVHTGIPILNNEVSEGNMENSSQSLQTSGDLENVVEKSSTMLKGIEEDVETSNKFSTAAFVDSIISDNELKSTSSSKTTATTEHLTEDGTTYDTTINIFDITVNSVSEKIFSTTELKKLHITLIKPGDLFEETNKVDMATETSAVTNSNIGEEEKAESPSEYLNTTSTELKDTESNITIMVSPKSEFEITDDTGNISNNQEIPTPLDMFDGREYPIEDDVVTDITIETPMFTVETPITAFSVVTVSNNEANNINITENTSYNLNTISNKSRDPITETYVTFKVNEFYINFTNIDDTMLSNNGVPITLNAGEIITEQYAENNTVNDNSINVFDAITSKYLTEPLHTKNETNITDENTNISKKFNLRPTSERGSSPLNNVQASTSLEGIIQAFEYTTVGNTVDNIMTNIPGMVLNEDSKQELVTFNTANYEVGENNIAKNESQHLHSTLSKLEDLVVTQQNFETTEFIVNVINRTDNVSSNKETSTFLNIIIEENYTENSAASASDAGPNEFHAEIFTTTGISTNDNNTIKNGSQSLDTKLNDTNDSVIGTSIAFMSTHEKSEISTEFSIKATSRSNTASHNKDRYEDNQVGGTNKFESESYTLYTPWNKSEDSVVKAIIETDVNIMQRTEIVPEGYSTKIVSTSSTSKDKIDGTGTTEDRFRVVDVTNIADSKNLILAPDSSIVGEFDTNSIIGTNDMSTQSSIFISLNGIYSEDGIATSTEKSTEVAHDIAEHNVEPNCDKVISTNIGFNSKETLVVNKGTTVKNYESSNGIIDQTTVFVDINDVQITTNIDVNNEGMSIIENSAGENSKREEIGIAVEDRAHKEVSEEYVQMLQYHFEMISKTTTRNATNNSSYSPGNTKDIDQLKAEGQEAEKSVAITDERLKNENAHTTTASGIYKYSKMNDVEIETQVTAESPDMNKIDFNSVDNGVTQVSTSADSHVTDSKLTLSNHIETENVPTNYENLEYNCTSPNSSEKNSVYQTSTENELSSIQHTQQDNSTTAKQSQLQIDYVTISTPAPHINSQILHTSANDFVCETAGRFPDPKNCSIFHDCLNLPTRYLHVARVCLSGTLYDRNSQTCTTKPVPCPESCTTVKELVDPTDCNRYYKCFWASLHKTFFLWQFKCLPRMVYDIERKECVNATLLPNCGGSSDTSANDAESPFNCVESGRFPMEYSCDSYYECKEKKGTFQMKAKTCSKGKLFDRGLGVCRKSDLVFCPYEYGNVVDSGSMESREDD
ncbi:hypothetical protein Trydic_g7330 [Trypoxylus dichotomus]